MDCLSGEVVDVLPAQLDLSRTDERIEILRVVVGPGGRAVPEGATDGMLTRLPQNRVLHQLTDVSSLGVDSASHLK